MVEPRSFRDGLLLFAILAGVIGVACVARAKSPQKGGGEPAKAEKTWGVLGEPVDMDFDQAQLKDVLKTLAARHGVEFKLDAAALKAAKTSDETPALDETPIFIAIKGVPLECALSLMLRELGLDFIVANDAIVITTHDKAAHTVESIRYDVADLLGRDRDMAELIDAARLAISPPAAAAIKAAKSNDERPSAPTQQAEKGDVTAAGSAILVRTTSRGHYELRRLLAELRRSNGRTAPDIVATSKSVLEVLEKPSGVEFDAVPLKDVVDTMKVRHSVEIQLDIKSLVDAGVSPDVSVTANLKGVSFERVLSPILKNYGLAFAVTDGLILITTPDQAAQTAPLWRIDVHDLLGGGRRMDELVKATRAALPKGSQEPSVASYRESVLLRASWRGYREVERAFAKLRENMKEKSGK